MLFIFNIFPFVAAGIVLLPVQVACAVYFGEWPVAAMWR